MSGRFGRLILVAVLAWAGLVPAANAGEHHHVTVDRHQLRGGQSLTVTATSTSECAWVLEWNGARQAKVARVLVATFSAPAVSQRARIPLHATCFMTHSKFRTTGAHPKPSASGSGTTAQYLRVTVPPSWRHTIPITVLPSETGVLPDETGLPGTGGPPLWLLLTGLGTLLGGVGLTTRRSRRTSRAGSRH
ncbi:MAG TPA: hypothetical protein VLI04_11890 [Nocardioidaceae bacterium]|nr:hypothetical protein [Nocardioidaceae bacterium]